MGPSGAGQLAKMCNQIAIAGLVQGLSESLHFAEKAGLSIPEVVEVISQGAAGSWQMQNRHQTMAENHFDFGFAVDWMRKDLASAWPPPTKPAPAAGDGAGRPVLQGSAGHGRRALGHLLADRKAAPVTPMLAKGAAIALSAGMGAVAQR